MTIWYMLIACWILEAKNTHSDYFSTAAMVARAFLSVTLYVNRVPARPPALLYSPLVDKLTLARLAMWC
jgi:hypothetical protein